MTIPASSAFLLTCCQIGAEDALKGELQRNWPELRPSYGRPGFVTFKWSGSAPLPADLDLRSVFARTHAFTLGSVRGDDARQMATECWQLVPVGVEFRQLHVWQRDWAIPGDRGFEPGVSLLAEAVAEQIAAAGPDPAKLQCNRIVATRTCVMDCVIVEPDQWWIGWHRAGAFPSRCPGGVVPIQPAGPIVSRAYRKTLEAIRWARLPIRRGDRCVELGAAPGGSCQALLELGCHVTGIDPADMDPSLPAHPHFTHIRARGRDLKRRQYRGFSWLLADLNVAPSYTLDTVEGIVTHRDVAIRGLILTLKFSDWRRAEDLPSYLERVRSWGYRWVRARHLASNRREICVVALRRPAMRRTATGRRQKPVS